MPANSTSHIIFNKAFNSKSKNVQWELCYRHPIMEKSDLYWYLVTYVDTKLREQYVLKNANNTN